MRVWLVLHEITRCSLVTTKGWLFLRRSQFFIGIPNTNSDWVRSIQNVSDFAWIWTCDSSQLSLYFVVVKTHKRVILTVEVQPGDYLDDLRLFKWTIRHFEVHNTLKILSSLSLKTYQLFCEETGYETVWSWTIRSINTFSFVRVRSSDINLLYKFSAIKKLGWGLKQI